MVSAELHPYEEVMKFILAKWISKPIYVAAKLNIADELSDGPKTIEKLAQKTDTHAPSLYRIMRALSCLGIFCELDDGRFELTPMAECLTSDALRPVALLMHSDWHDKAWGHLFESVKTGETAFDKVHGMPAFNWFEENPEAAQIFNEANAIKAVTSHRAIIDVYDFSVINSLTDIGGGNGALVAEILKANLSLCGIVADLPAVVTTAEDLIRNYGLESRCQVVECDFFKKIPTGSDAYMMSHVLHDWNDEECRIILKNLYMATSPGTKLLVVEALIPKGNEFSIAKLLDVEVFVMGGGRERTKDEFLKLFQSTGFELLRVIPTNESISVIEAIRKV